MPQWFPPSQDFTPSWEGKLIEKIHLKNDLVLEIWDYSRKLAGDRWLVGFLAQIKITPSKEDFSNEFYYKYFLENTDGYLYYRYRKERTFIPEEEVSQIFEKIKKTFLEAVIPYLSLPHFRENLIKSEIAQFEKKIDWELILKAKEKEEEGLEKLWKNKEFF